MLQINRRSALAAAAVIAFLRSRPGSAQNSPDLQEIFRVAITGMTDRSFALRQFYLVESFYTILSRQEEWAFVSNDEISNRNIVTIRNAIVFQKGFDNYDPKAAEQSLEMLEAIYSNNRDEFLASLQKSGVIANSPASDAFELAMASLLSFMAGALGLFDGICLWPFCSEA